VCVCVCIYIYIYIYLRSRLFDFFDKLNKKKLLVRVVHTPACGRHLHFLDDTCDAF